MNPGRPWTRATARLLPVFLFLFFLAPGPAFNQEPPKPTDQGQTPGETAPATPDASVLRTLKKSLFVPGWGQASEKRYFEAALFFCAEAVCLAGVLIYNGRGNENYLLYKKASTTEDAVRLRALTERYDKRRNRFILAAAAVWALNLVDAYLIVSGKDGKDKIKNLRFRIETGEDPQLAFSLRLGF